MVGMNITVVEPASRAPKMSATCSSSVMAFPAATFIPSSAAWNSRRSGLRYHVVAGNDDRVEVAEQADPVQLATRVRALRVGDERERVALAEGAEHLADMRIQACTERREMPRYIWARNSGICSSLAAGRVRVKAVWCSMMMRRQMPAASN